MTRIVHTGSFDPYPWGELQTDHYIQEALLQLGHEVIATPKEPQKILEAMEQSDPDVWLLQTPRDLDSRVALEVRRRWVGCKIALWIVDPLGFPVWLFRFGRLADVVFTKEQALFPWYRRQGLNPVWLDTNGVPDHFPFGDSTYARRELDADVAFVGNLHARKYRDRVPILHQLASRYAVRIYSTQPAEWRREGFDCVSPPLVDDGLAQVSASSRIVLGLNASHPCCESEKYWSNRVSMTLGTGGFLANRYVVGMEDIYENRRHMVWFRSLPELMELTDHYLYADEERDRIRHQGYDYVHAHHTYKHRVREALSHVEDLEPGRRGSQGWISGSGTIREPAASEDGSSSIPTTKRWLRRYVPEFRGCLSVLDLSPRRGEFLDLLAEAGIKAEGVAEGPAMARLLIRRGHSVAATSLVEMTNLEGGAYDGIFAYRLTNDLDVADGWLDQAARLLQPGGRLVVVARHPRDVRHRKGKSEGEGNVGHALRLSRVVTEVERVGLRVTRRGRERDEYLQAPPVYPLWPARYPDAIRRRALASSAYGLAWRAWQAIVDWALRLVSPWYRRRGNLFVIAIRPIDPLSVEP